jgi:hypothetical protein
LHGREHLRSSFADERGLSKSGREKDWAGSVSDRRHRS